VVNVLDWGAGVGGNVSTAIQAAIDYCINKGGGKIFFPPGIYRVTSLAVGINDPSKANNGVQIIGSGQGSVIAGSTDFVLSKGGRTYDLLELVEDINIQGSTTSPNGAIRFTKKGAIANNVYTAGWYGIDASQCDAASIYGCSGLGPTNWAVASDPTHHGF